MRRNWVPPPLRCVMQSNFLLMLAGGLSLFQSPQVQAQTFKVLHAFRGSPDGNHPSAGLTVDHSGSIYGTTFVGGASYYGTAFKLRPGTKERVLYSFDARYGAHPDTTLVRDVKGMLYGATLYGGDYRSGTVFKLDKNYNETVLHTFHEPAEGYWPNALIGDGQGNLYGTTEEGGNSTCNYGEGCGVVFKLDKGKKETVLHAFVGGTDGAQPSGGLVRDTLGNLYGTTYFGGDLISCPPFGCGTVFKIDPNGTETILYSFTGAGGDGSNPSGSIVLDENGTLYGATATGGGAGCPGFQGECGTVFKLDASGAETVLYRFTGTNGDGRDPEGGVVMDAAGNLYGTTRNGGNTGCYTGCGTAFRLGVTGDETVLHRFSGGWDGALPSAGLALDASGKLYGVAQYGGDPHCRGGGGCGTVFVVTVVSGLQIGFRATAQIPEQGSSQSSSELASVP